MRVLIVTNHFWPENFRINDLAVGLRERGHEITVLTGIPDYPGGKFFDGYGVFGKRVEEYQGVKVVHYPLIPRGRGRGRDLVLNYLSSALLSCLVAPFYCRDKYDLIFVFETSPVTIGLPAIVVKKLKSIPIIFWILDLWPESISDIGGVRSPGVLRFGSWLVKFIYRRCDKILVSSRGFIRSIEASNAYRGEIGYFPNWVEPEYAVEGDDKSTFELPELPGGFRVMFAGNIGVCQDFGTILNAAELLKDHSDIHWVILGDGRMADWVKEQVHSRDLGKQVHLLGRYPAETMLSFFSRADAMLITLQREGLFALTVPGKLQSYMACGKPIIAALDGEGGEVIEEAGAGLVSPAENPEALAEVVLKMYRMSPGERQKMGERGRDYCMDNFDREKLFDKVEGWMVDVAGIRGGKSGS